MKNEMGREGEGENSPNLDQEVEEGERKKMVCLVSLGMLSIHTCKKEKLKKEEEEEVPAVE